MNLQRFLDAQANFYVSALSELKRGRKSGHWMWFVFPQFRGLGVSVTSEHYAIHSLAEAKAYLAHPVLGSRLTECAEAVLSHIGLTIVDIFGYTDALKFQSSMTLFECASERNTPFTQALEKYYGGQRDSKTIDLIEACGNEK